MDSNLFPILARLLKTLNVSFNNSYLRGKLFDEVAIGQKEIKLPKSLSFENSDANWESTIMDLKAMILVMDHYGLQTEINEETNFDSIEMPTLMVIYNEPQHPKVLQHAQVTYSWMLLYAKHKDKFCLFNQEQSEVVLSREEIQTKSIGLSLSIEDTSYAGEPKYLTNRINSILNKLGFVLLGSMILGLLALVTLVDSRPLSDYHTLWLPVLLSNVIGLLVVISLKRVEINYNNSGFLGKFCNLRGGHSCSSVLSSNSSNILSGRVKMSSIGVVFFLGNIIAILIALVSARHGAISMLATLTVLCLPYTAYSVIYQWKVVKSWCTLCLIVQVLIWLQFTTYYLNSVAFFTSPNVDQATILTLAFLIATGGSLFITGFYSEKANAVGYRHSLLALQRNDRVIKALIGGPPVLFELPPQPVIIGNPHGQIEVVAVLGLNCHHCGEVYADLQQLVKKRKEVCVRIFPAFPSQKAPVLTDILSLTSSGNHVEAHAALRTWYHLLESRAKPSIQNFDVFNEMLYKKWRSTLSINFDQINHGDARELFREHLLWYRKYDFSRIPKIFVNRRLWPAEYSTELMEYFIEEIIEMELAMAV